jgi:hypothetical protein
MTARLLPLSVASLCDNARLGDRTAKPNGPPDLAPPLPAFTKSGKPKATKTGKVGLDGVWNALIESLPQGIIILSPALALIYANYRARELCQQLANTDFELTALPAVIFNICRKFSQEATNEPLVVEVPGEAGALLRLQVRWLYTGPNHHAYLWVQVENCEEMLREELWIEQKKYDLTERESEIWILMRQEYTYVEIAEMLQISANTVKTHVKHIYAKRRSSIHLKRFWASR